MVHKRLPGGSVMHRSISFAVVLLLFVAIVGSLAPLPAQEITAAIVGTVVDPSGAPINGSTTVPTIAAVISWAGSGRSEEHTSELQSRGQLVCRLLLETKNI